MSGRKPVIRASDLARLAICEQKAAFEHLHGERLTREAVRHIGDGNRAHARYFKEAFAINSRVDSSEPKPGCFISTCVFGRSAPETHALRSLRDEVLRRHTMGRALTRLYYRMSPGMAHLLEQHAWAAAMMRLILRPVARLSRRAVRKAG